MHLSSNTLFFFILTGLVPIIVIGPFIVIQDTHHSNYLQSFLWAQQIIGLEVKYLVE